jgi:type II secretory pathway pseudopilin PulG
MTGIRRQSITPRGTTLVELTVATAILATVFAAILPLFAAIRNSVEMCWANLEILQNARVLNEHLGRHLAQARQIVAVSASTDDAGYIEFEDHEGVVYRCDAGSRGYVEFGPLGHRHELAGPVQSFRITCYGATDFDRPVQTPAEIQLVTWEARFQGMGSRARDKIVTGACCLRARY